MTKSGWGIQLFLLAGMLLTVFIHPVIDQLIDQREVQPAILDGVDGSGKEYTVSEGDYRLAEPLVIEGHGTSNEPIVITVEGVFHQPTSEPAIIIKGDWIKLIGIEVDGSNDVVSQPAITITNASNILIQDCNIHSGTGNGILITNGANNVEIDNCTISNMDELANGIYNPIPQILFCLLGIGSLVVTIYNPEKSIPIAMIGALILVSVTPLAHNQFFRGDGRDSHGIAIMSGTSNVHIHDCEIWGNSGDSIQIVYVGPSNAIPADNVLIENNTLWGNREESIDVKTSSNVKIINNQFSGSRSATTSSGGKLVVIHGNPMNVEVSNNEFSWASRGISSHAANTPKYQEWPKLPVNISINNNSFDLIDGGMFGDGIVVDVYDSRNVIVENNTYDDVGIFFMDREKPESVVIVRDNIEQSIDDREEPEFYGNIPEWGAYLAQNLVLLSIPVGGILYFVRKR